MFSEKFENELKQFEVGLYLKFQKGFDLNFQLFQDLFQIIDENKEKIKLNDDFKWVVNFLFLKTYKIYWSILILCKKGLGTEAAVLWRSLFEHTVDLYWISKDQSIDRAKKFRNYLHIARKHLYDKYDEYNIFSKIPNETSQGMETKEEIKKLYDEVKDDYKDERKWSKKNIREKARNVGLSFDYEFYYWYYSFLVHPNEISRFDYATVNQQQFYMGPTHFCIRDVLVLSYKILLGSFIKWSEVFNLKYEDKKKEFLEKLKTIAAKV